MTATLVAEHLEAETGGFVQVRNNGGYIADFTVTYDFKGKNFSKDSGHFTLGVNKSINLPAGATNIVINCKELWFINSWSTIFNEAYAKVGDYCFEISGTTLNPSWKPVSCG